jgi:hypothetical protein
MYRITYDYEFLGRKSVTVPDLGEVPAKGKFSYLTNEDHLEFMDAQGQRILTSIPLREKVGETSVQYPRPEDFPENFRDGTWKLPGSFQEHILKVLNELFKDGFVPDRRGNVNRYITTYRSLSNLPAGIRAKVAVLVSQPYDPARKAFKFHIQQVAYESRSHSTDWRPASAEEVKNAARSLVDQLISQLSNAGEDSGGK